MATTSTSGKSIATLMARTPCARPGGHDCKVAEPGAQTRGTSPSLPYRNMLRNALLTKRAPAPNHGWPKRGQRPPPNCTSQCAMRGGLRGPTARGHAKVTPQCHRRRRRPPATVGFAGGLPEARPQTRPCMSHGRRVVELCKERGRVVQAFGATSSVQNLSWAARALCHILVQSLCEALTHTMDDFPAVGRQLANLP